MFSANFAQLEDSLADKPDEMLEAVTRSQVELNIMNEELREPYGHVYSQYQEQKELYEYAPCGHLLLDAEGRILSCNKKGYRLLGVVRQQGATQYLASFLAASSLPVLAAALRQAEESLATQQVELELDQDGHRVSWVLADIKAERSRQGEVRQFVSITDITAMKQRELALMEALSRAERHNSATAALVSQACRKIHLPLNELRQGLRALQGAALSPEQAGQVRNALGACASLAEDVDILQTRVGGDDLAEK